MASKNKPTAIISGAGWLMQFAILLIETLRTVGGWDDERIHALITKNGREDLERGVAAFVEVLAGKLFNPAEYFRTRPGLYVWEGFTKQILSVAAPATAPNVKLREYNLPRNMTDAEIQAELGEGHVFTNASEFCATLAQMLDAQWSGEEGDLLANGYANIFYVRGSAGEVFAVRVLWHADYREWRVHAYRLDGSRWFAGSRAFSATADA